MFSQRLHRLFGGPKRPSIYLWSFRPHILQCCLTYKITLKSEGNVQLKLKSLLPENYMVSKFGENCQIFFIHIIINKMRGTLRQQKCMGCSLGSTKNMCSPRLHNYYFLPYGKTNDFLLTYKPWTITFRMDAISPPYAQKYPQLYGSYK